jgi:hypothetical protein
MTGVINIPAHRGLASAPGNINPGRILAKAMRHRVSFDGPDGCITTIRYNSREFHIEILPFYIPMRFASYRAPLWHVHYRCHK